MIYFCECTFLKICVLLFKDLLIQKNLIENNRLKVVVYLSFIFEIVCLWFYRYNGSWRNRRLETRQASYLG